MSDFMNNIEAIKKNEMIAELIHLFHSKLENIEWTFYDLKSIFIKFEIGVFKEAGYYKKYTCENKVLKLYFEYDNSRTYFWILNKILHDSSDFKIQNLYNYIFGENNIKKLFTNAYSPEILATDEKYENLNLYLNECYKCIKSSNLIAGAILLRSCLEIFINKYSAKYHVHQKIEDVIKNFNEINDFKLFDEISKKDEIEKFFKEIKNLGNDSVHLNGKKIKEIINTFDIERAFTYMCIIIENTILTEEIDKKLKNDQKKKLSSFDFHEIKKEDKYKTNIENS
jgi:hypothetical protein